VRPLDFPLLTDENIAADLVAGLRARGCDVRSVEEERLIGRGDGDVLERATALHRVVVTHDLAFGKADIRSGASFVGIVYLRPGHISAAFVLAMVDALRESSIDVQPPFMIVAERRQTTIRVRVRTAPPW
jgi:predicted nuclease of predicted toxin-antitoxin system